MRERATKRAWLLAVPLVLALSVAACDDDCPACTDPGIVPPTDGAGYLGYTNLVEAEGFTTCGLCHATFQSGWTTTGHSHAWETLQANPGAASYCEGCHTTNQLGNADTEDSGFLASGDTVFHDVQCENCHSGGATHAEDPTSTQPLATIKADTAATTGCGECHEGTHHPFVEQWRESGHGQLNSYPAGRDGCNQCHEGRMALETKFYETANYIEKFEGPDSLQPIVCVVCHDPHGSDFEANLRAPIDIGSFDHLCVRCHARHAVPPSTRGAHAGQGFLVLADDVGWIPDGFVDPGIHAHGGILNDGVCVTCHVNMFTVEDTAGAHVFTSVGHLFEPIPCLDADGIPEAGPCADADRDWTACLACHPTEAAVIADYNATWDSINVLLDILWVDSNANDTMDVADIGLLPMVVAQGDTVELDPSDDIVTVAEGALFNGQVAYTDDRPFWGEGARVNGVGFSSHKMSGNGVHNPDYLIELLLASISAVNTKYFTP